MSEPDERARETVEAADEGGRKGFQADRHHGAGEPGVERDQHAGERAGQRREAPGERVDGVQVDAALRREQRVLPGGAHAHAPAAETQEAEQCRIDGGGREHQHGREGRDAGAAPQYDWRIVERERLRGILLLRRPDQHDEPAQQDAERDGGEHRREHHLAGHLAHEEQIDENADREAQPQRGRKRADGAVGEQRRGGEQQIGAEHHQLAMRQVEHAADPIDQHVAARDQRVDRGEDDDVDDELH